MPADSRDPFAALESYLAEKALGASLLADFLSVPSGTTTEATTTTDEAEAQS